MEAEFTSAVEEGLNLAKRVVHGGGSTRPPPRPAGGMERSPSLLPTAPMVYAVISDPGIVDNPDIPSYQPHVYGRCDPPALIPLQMKEITAEVECHLDTAVVSVRGRWRVHCVMASRSCDCRLVVPMGERGSILGVEVEIARRSYSTEVIRKEEYDQKMGQTVKKESDGFMNPHSFSITVPQVSGGSDIIMKVSWSQKLLYKDGQQFAINIPFTFPEYVTAAKIFSKKEKIQLNVDTGTAKEVLIQRTSHALKEKGRHAGKLFFLYEAEVENWSTQDFNFSYSVYSNDPFGGVLLQSPSVHDYDQREMFCLYLFPGSTQSRKVFRKEVVFLVDISGSMRGKPLENVKNALSSALLELTPADYFDIIAFNEDVFMFSSSLEPATKDMLQNATQWISKNFVAEGGTNIMKPLNEAMHLLSKTRNAYPHIFLVTDGAVEDERNVCGAVRNHVTNRGYMAPRISTFGIGLYCNHYFLLMLSSIGRGQHDAAYDSGSIGERMQRWFSRAWSPFLAEITVDTFDHLDAFEAYPFNIPDLFVGFPLIISGRYLGKFPDSLKAKGSSADMSDIVVDLKVQRTKDIPLEKVFAKQHIDLLTAQAWYSDSKQLEEKVTTLSIRNGVPSEYTYMILLKNQTEKQDTVKQPKKHDGAQDHIITMVHGMAFGFGNVTATLENLPPGFGEAKQPEGFAVLNKAVSCCSSICDCCCCMCCIQCLSRLSDQCVISITQLCTALSCFACFECCSEVCCDGSN